MRTSLKKTTAWLDYLRLLCVDYFDRPEETYSTSCVKPFGSLGNSHSFQKTAILSLYLSISLWHYGVDVKCRTSLLFRQFSNSDEINCRPLSVFSPPGNSPSRSAAMSCRAWTGSVVLFTGSERGTCALTDIHETFYIFFRYLFLPQATKPMNGAYVLFLLPLMAFLCQM